MFLKRLVEYAEEEIELPPTLYEKRPVRYIVALGQDGRLLSPEPIDTADPDDKTGKNGTPRYVPSVQRTSGVKPLLLASNSEYTLGLAREKSKPQRVAHCHAAYLEQLERCVQRTQLPAVAAVLRFLRSKPLEQLRLPADWKPDATITFTVDGVFVVDLPEVQAFWAEENDPAADPNRPASVMQCLICGERRPVLERLQSKIKGVPGGQTSGTSLISANAPAFESYGQSASLIAPTCPRCGERFTQGLNRLLASRSNHISLGNAVLVFWTRGKTEFDLFGLLSAPEPEEVAALVQAARRGGPLPAIDHTAFYAAVLTGSGGRAVVRDWIDTTVGDVKKHLARWFAWQAVVGPDGRPARPLGVYSLAAATVHDAKKNPPPPPVARALWRCALSNTPLPGSLLWQAVARNMAERKVSSTRAALIKAVLASRASMERTSEDPLDKEDEMVELDENSPSAAYRCGRLLAVIEEVQRLAIPGIKATVVDRFYGTASTAPASVFSRLLRGAQPHLAKLERDKPGAYRALQQRLQDILAGVSAFPKTLSLEEQGLFALGYYHQRAFDRAQAMAAAERRRAQQATDMGLADLAEVPLTTEEKED